MYEAADIERLVGKPAATYAANKNRGGRNNANGATYETYYAGLRAIQLMAQALREDDDGASTWLAAQQLCFIDDLIVETADGRRHSQLKQGQQTSWTSGDHPIADDVRLQSRLDQGLRQSATYELVVPEAALRDRLEAARPDDIVAEVVRFSDATDIQVFLAEHPEIAADIDQIALRPGRSGSRGEVLKTVLGAWVTAPARTSLQDFARHAADGPGPVVAVLGPEYQLPQDVADHLASIPGLDFEMRKKHLWYRFGRFVGRSWFRAGTAEFTRFERFIAENKPADGFAVIEALSEDG